MSEHRKHPRKSVELPVAFQSGGGPLVEATCRDIGLGGMFVETDQPAPYGSKVTVYCELPGLSNDAEIEGTVQWVKKGVGMGVQFGVMGARETHALIELVKRA